MKNYRLHALIALCSSAALMSGCSHLPFSKHKDEYKSAAPGTVLEIPPDLTKPAYDKRFNIPEADSDATHSAYEIASNEKAEPAVPSGAILSGQNNDITMTVAQDRAWRLVGIALDRAGFTVDDQDRAKGIYFVSYVEPAKEDKGLLTSLEFWKDKASPKPVKYRILVAGRGAGSAVTVLDKDGFSEHTETSSRILKLLYEHLK